MAETEIEPESPLGSFFFYYYIDSMRTLQVCYVPFFWLAEVRESAPGSLTWEGILVISLVQSLLCEVLQILLFKTYFKDCLLALTSLNSLTL